MAETISPDYLVIGAGAMGMAFVDTLVSDTKATVALVDRYSRPGGHWTIAYPFVRLHQPSAFYGVNSRPLGDDKVDQIGLNKGMSELATGDEVCAYFSRVMHQTFLPSGRVAYYPMHEYVGKGEFRSITTGKITRVGKGTRLVDATYMKVKVPAMSPPSYEVLDGVDLITPSDLAKIHRPYGGYTVVGAGKTGVDACLWLLASATKDASSLDDLFLRLEACGRLLRIDKERWPTMFRCAILSIPELEQVKRVGRIIRHGRVMRISTSQVTLEKGSYRPVPDTLYIDCTADALARLKPVPVFGGNHITLQPVRLCQQVFSAAFIAHVDATYDDESVKNELCGVVPHPDETTDFLSVYLQTYRNRLKWFARPRTVAWLKQARLDVPPLRSPPEDPVEAASFDASQPAIIQAMCNKFELLQKVSEDVIRASV
ncbi:hypothetical protein BS50DRAFT_661336 [Corynespora cassiicola Philippines]|uniref:FAD/NAD(P)-binding domain-containing protein n=1 Tax=Corynespora cassiicola Philippines TaxID=1448308 RepID=A0A2T2N0L5_CORCC|nr:hypothetical protein BS50DRAFT_661336 [Corynespora cassiicola Philippines]